MSEGIIQPHEPVTFQARNPYPRYSRLKDGDCFKVTLEVSEDDWNRLKTMPVNAILEVMLWHHDGDGKTMEEATGAKEKKPKKEPGPFAAYWNRMFAQGYHANFELMQALEVNTPAEVKPALYKVFDVDSMSDVAPIEYESWCDRNNLHMQITLSRQAFSKTAEQVNEQTQNLV